MLTFYNNLENDFFKILDLLENKTDHNFYENTKEGSPAVNFYEDEDKSLLTFEVPGLEKSDLKIEIKEDILNLSGKRAVEYDKDSKVSRKERNNFKFSRSFKIPHKTVIDKVKATVENGILTIELPKAEEAKTKEILIS